MPNATYGPDSAKAEQGTPRAIVDIDRHVQETWNIFGEYAEPAFRDHVYKRIRLPDGRSGLEIAGRVMPGWSAAMWDDPSANEFFHDHRFSPNNPEIVAHDTSSFLAAMDREGIDIAILTPTLALGNGSIPIGQVGSALGRAYTRWAKEFRSASPDRLHPLHPINLYDVEQAAIDSRWAIEEMQCCGLLLVSLPVGGRSLDHPDFDPFWAVAQDLDAAVQIHSVSSLPDAAGQGPLVDLVAGAPRLGGNLFMHHAVSHRVEPEIAMLSLIAGGVLERFPRLRIAFSESGGGWVASWAAAMDDRYHSSMAKWVPWLKMQPSDYLRHRCLIGFEANENGLCEYAAQLGTASMAWFSDYAHWDSVYPGAVDKVRRSVADLPLEQQRAILGENALRFYGLAAAIDGSARQSPPTPPPSEPN